MVGVSTIAESILDNPVFVGLSKTEAEELASHCDILVLPSGRSVFEQGQLLDAVYSVNTSRQFNFSISRKGLRSLGNYQNFISSSSNFKISTNYFSKNKKYRFRTHYTNQKIFSEQNGGTNNSDILNFADKQEKTERGPGSPGDCTGILVASV